MTTHMNGPEIGQTAPTLSLSNDSGQTHTLHTLMGQNGLLLIFVNGTWCPTCVGTLYYMSKHTVKLGQLGVKTAIVAIDEAGTLRAFRQSASVPLTYELLADPDEVARNAYGVTASEVYLLIDREGMVRERYHDPEGHVRPGRATLEDAIRAMGPVNV